MIDTTSRARAAEIITTYLDARAGELTAEAVWKDFWYVRVPGSARSVIPIELLVGQRTVRAWSSFAIEPEEMQAEAYRFLLRHNFAATGVSFAVAPDDAICLVGRVGLREFDERALDELIGKIVDTTETTFQSYLRIGFASRFARP